ncbi:hypothetical protein GvMRE_I1g617 [endosymbiont GvMRE of Glomus versiforme]|nr:hypothetical protein GvMRE_I1g617 [endosymbiont GvMRE of Glomus versiforme]
MTKRQQYIYQLIGKITDKKAKKKQDKTIYYSLAVIISDQEKIQKINAFSDSCNSAVWKALQANQFLGKEYLFHCKNFMGTYYLINWEKMKEADHEN